MGGKTKWQTHDDRKKQPSCLEKEISKTELPKEQTLDDEAVSKYLNFQNGNSVYTPWSMKNISTIDGERFETDRL